MEKNKTIESTLAKYLEFRVFELFKNRLVKIIAPHCRENSKEDIYKHLFLCPAQMAPKRNFQLHGVLSPFVCLWRTSPLLWNTDFYARSVLYRDFIYDDKEGNKLCERGFLYDFVIQFQLFSSSYYKDFRDRVNIDLIDMDRLRYFDFELKELLKDCSTWLSRAEVKLTNLASADNVDAEKNRSFDLTASYEVRISVPYCHGFGYLDAIKVYLNENLIYEKDAEAVPEDQSSQTNP